MKQLGHNVYYNLDTEEKNDYLKYIERKITRNKKEKPLFFSMLQIVKENTKHYLSDFFVHDYNAFTIDRGLNNRFLWIVYDCGTKLIYLDNDFTEFRDRSWEYFEMLKENYMKDPSHQLFFVNLEKNTLKKTDPALITVGEFKHRYGKIEEYFNKHLQTSETFFEDKNKFKNLLQEYSNHPPKVKIDEILSQ